jgi:hypothetical protein
MFGIPMGNIALFLLFIVVLDYWYARRRQRQIAKLIEDHDNLVDRADELQARLDLMSVGAMDTLPLAVADAEAVFFIIDRIPENIPECQINVQIPAIWMNPRTQRSWRWNDREGVWEENTIIGRNEVNQMSIFTRGDVFIHASTVYQAGLHGLLTRALTTVNASGDQAIVQEAIGTMHAEVCAGMDAQDQEGEQAWTIIRQAHLDNQTVAFDVRSTRAVQPGAPDNPFSDARRPINFDD